MLSRIRQNMRYHMNGGKFFSIEQEDENFYYLISLYNSEFLYAISLEEAEQCIKLIEPMYDWTRVNDIQDFYEKDREAYEKVAVHLRKFGVPIRKNGNYRATKSQNGFVKYRIKDKLCTGKELSYGVAYRDHKLDIIFADESVYYFSDEEKAVLFIEFTKQWVPWNEEKILSMIRSDNEMYDFLKQTIDRVENEKTLIEPDVFTAASFTYLSFGSDDEQKYEVYVESTQHLDSLIGLNYIKSYVEKMLKIAAADKKLLSLNISTKRNSMHSLFVGPPGTGKTEVARLMADLLWSLDVIEEHKLTEVSKEDFVGLYEGETEKKTKRL